MSIVNGSEAAEAIRQKERLLSAADGGYAPIPHFIYRELLPDLKDKYEDKPAGFARDTRFGEVKEGEEQ